MKISLGEIFAGLFIVGGLASCVESYSLYKEFNSSTNWSETNGRISRSNIVSGSYIDKPGRCFYPRIKYVYSVNGVTYKSERVDFSGITFSCIGKNRAKNLVKKYPIKKSVRVYYDENNPKNSVVQRTGWKKIILITVLGIVFSCLGIGAWKFID